MTTTIVTRSGKGSPLTNTELDANFTNLKTTADAAISSSGNNTLNGNLIVTGDLEVQGTTTSIDSTTVEITDLNITLAKDATNNTQANGAGITIAGSNAELKYVSTGDNWTINKNLSLGDNVKAQFGASDDLQIYHDGSNSYIEDAGTGNLWFKSNGATIGFGNSDLSELFAVFNKDGASKLYFNNSSKIETTSTGISVTGGVVASAISQFTDVNIPDNNAIRFGNSQDLQIYHDGSASYIKENGTGDLIIQGSNTMRLQGSSNQELANFSTGGAVTLFHNGSAKLATTSTGIDVTGSVVADGLLVGDNDYIYAGNGADLKIGHDGSSNIIRSQGHPLYIDSNGIIFRGYSPYTNHMNIASNGDISFYNSAGSSQNFYWDSSTSRLGLGVTNPSAPLVVNATASSEGLRVQRNNVSSQYISIHQATGGDHVIETFGNKALNFGVRDAQPLTIKTNNTTRLTINADGSSVFSGSTSVTGSASANTSAITMGFTAPDGEIKVKNTTGAPASNLDFYTTNSSGTTAIAMRLTDEKDVSISRNLTMNGTLIGASSISCGDITSSGTITGAQDFKATGNNMKLHAGGNHIINMDLNGKFYPQTHNAVDLGHSSTLAFRNLYLSGTISSGAITSTGLTSSGDAIFQGNVTHNNNNASSKYFKLNVASSGDGHLLLQRNNQNYWQIHSDSSNVLKFDGYNGASSAVFSGSVTSTGLTVSGTFLKTGTNGNYTIAASGNDFYYGRNGTNYHIANTANGGFQFLTGSSSAEALRITSAQNINIANGSVGIGFTSAPSAKLEVQGGTTYPAMKLSRDGGSAGTQGYTTYGHSAIGYSGGTGADTYIVSEHGFGFAVNAGTNALTITDTGNATFSGSVSATSGDYTTSGTASLADGTNGLRIVREGGDSAGSLGNGITFAQRWWSNSTQNVRTGAIFGKKTNGSGGYGGGLAFYSQPASGADMVEALSIDSSQRVSIGSSLMVGSTTAPDNKVNILESALSGRSASNGNTSLTIEHATDTGIQFFSATQTQLRFGDASDTGSGAIIYTHSDNTLRLSANSAHRFTIGGTEAMRIDSSGRLLVNSSSNTSRGGTNTRALIKLATGENYVDIQASSTSANGGLLFSDGSGGNFGLIDYAHASDSMLFYTAAQERARLTSGGDFLVGGPSSGGANTATLHANGSATFDRASGTVLSLRRNTNDGTVVLFLDDDEDGVGSISISGSTTTYNTSSDARLKENIEDADDSGHIIDKIKVRQFDFKKTGKHQDYGMIAQELILEVPDAVSTPTEDHEMMGVDYSKLVPLMMKEIQNLRKEIKSLKEKE